MGKFRSKLKRSGKGKNWKSGQSSTCNPENKKHRNMAKSRFFQTNLSLAPGNASNKSKLTLEALSNHEAIQSFASDNVKSSAVNNVAESLNKFNLNGDNMTASNTYETYASFASNFTGCTNMTFSRFLNNYKPKNEHQDEILTTLAALTTTIKERGGQETSTEYFLYLLELLKEHPEGDSKLTILRYAIKTVPIPVLRLKFNDCRTVLSDLLETYIENSNFNAIENIIRCMTVLLCAQEYSLWSLPSTHKLFDTMLLFCLHLNPGVRKRAHHSIGAIINGCCFMTTQNNKDDDQNIAKETLMQYHPASERISRFCQRQFKPENIAQNVVNYTLNMLPHTFNGLNGSDIKIICEHILSIMTAAQFILLVQCLSVLRCLFQARPKNLSDVLCAKLMTALYEFRPDKSDIKPTLGWLETMKDGFICLLSYNLNLCINSLPRFMDICVNHLWLSANSEITDKTTNIIKDIFLYCIKPACLIDQQTSYHASITKSLHLITSAFNFTPFSNLFVKVIVTFGYIFEATGKHFQDVLQKPLTIIAGLYDSDGPYRLAIENTIHLAIQYLGPEAVLTAIPIKNTTTNKFLLDHSWTLPLLRTGISESTLEYFANNILPLAEKCDLMSKAFKESGDVPGERTYELLCWQLWGLFPGFCRKPKDIEYFRYIAKTLGGILNNNPDIREPVIDGLKGLIKNSDDIGKLELAKYAKNFLPRLFNIYTTKVKLTHEKIIRQSTFELIKEYVVFTPMDIQNEFFTTAKVQLNTLEKNSFLAECVIDIMKILVLYQTSENIKEFYDEHVSPVLLKHIAKKSQNAKEIDMLRQQQLRAYNFLEETMNCNNIGCVEFIQSYVSYIKKLLINKVKGSFRINQVPRLNCLQTLIEKKAYQTINDNLIKKSIDEAVVCFDKAVQNKENIALNLLTKIGDLYENENNLNEFIDNILIGFNGDTNLKSNTIYALKGIVNYFAGSITVETLKYILEQISVYIVGKNRKETEAGVSFLITFIKVLPTPLVANHLEVIVKSLSAMVPDTKRYCRRYIGFILRKLCHKFSTEEISKLVPANDEIFHKRLRNINKELHRIKDRKLQNLQKTDKHNKTDDDDDNDDDDSNSIIPKMEKISLTMDDILTDTDSESDEELIDDDKMNSNKKMKNKHKIGNTYIKEYPESILDLTDVNAIGNITTTKPGSSKTNNDNMKPKVKDPNRGFKTAPDGRLIITEPKFKHGKRSDDEDNEDDGTADVDVNNKNHSIGGKRNLNIDSDDEVEMNGIGPKKKLKPSDSQSISSNKSNKYVAGGKGIHRNMNSNSSVRSGVSSRSHSTNTNHSSKKYKATKASGDVKKKGQVNPYAYISLSRNIINKRKQAKMTGKFKNIVKGAKKGAKSGSKKRK